LKVKDNLGESLSVYIHSAGNDLFVCMMLHRKEKKNVTVGTPTA